MNLPEVRAGQLWHRPPADLLLVTRAWVDTSWHCIMFDIIIYTDGFADPYMWTGCYRDWLRAHNYELLEDVP